MRVNRIDHVSINVSNLSEAKAFFLDLGLEVQAEWELNEENSYNRIVGLNNVKTACVGLGMPDGEAWIELVKFYTPSDQQDIQQPFLQIRWVSDIFVLLLKTLKPLLQS